jgi:hypothetical protein
MFGSHNAGHRRFAAKVDTVAGVDISKHPTKYDDFTSRYIGGNSGILRDRDPAVGSRNYPFDIALNDQRLRSNNFTLDLYGLTNRY